MVQLAVYTTYILPSGGVICYQKLFFQNRFQVVNFSPLVDVSLFGWVISSQPENSYVFNGFPTFFCFGSILVASLNAPDMASGSTRCAAAEVLRLAVGERFSSEDIWS